MIQSFFFILFVVLTGHELSSNYIPFLVESLYIRIYKTLVKMAIVKVWPVLEISFSFICQDLTNDKKVKKGESE